METRTPGCKRICVRVGDLYELASSWGVVYLFFPLPFVRKPIKNPKFKLKCQKNGYFSLANNENKPTPFLPRVAFAMGDWS